MLKRADEEHPERTGRVWMGVFAALLMALFAFGSCTVGHERDQSQ